MKIIETALYASIIALNLFYLYLLLFAKPSVKFNLKKKIITLGVTFAILLALYVRHFIINSIPLMILNIVLVFLTSANVIITTREIEDEEEYRLNLLENVLSKMKKKFNHTTFSISIPLTREEVIKIADDPEPSLEARRRLNGAIGDFIMKASSVSMYIENDIVYLKASYDVENGKDYRLI